MIIILKYFREVLLCLAWMLGWGLVTWALVDLFGSWVVKFSVGVLLLGLVGYGFILKVFSYGIYALLIDEEKAIENKVNNIN
ncbi:hypothetical protein [Halonatronum saccharophilum]|uniref:hypothetical protein n=1 Tax=Halonatronum saccharophilum TaxID=150060 RepID=UPI0004880261|nr:hypothetical protein [Halonatronum saccharophilum]